MPKTFKMQAWNTMKGATVYASEILQPSYMWIDGAAEREATIDVHVLGNTVSTGSTLCDLVLQSAAVPEGPWFAIATISDAYCRTTKYFTSDEGGTSKFDRLMRWKLDPSSATGNWSITFRLCATLK